MIAAYKKFWLNYTNFTGRSSRADYWWVSLIQLLVVLPVCAFLFGNLFSSWMSILPYLSESGELVGISEEAFVAQLLSQVFSPATVVVWLLFFIYSLATFVPQLALTVRRLRDGGFHWAFIFIGLLPYIGSIVLLVLLALPTKGEHGTELSESHLES